MATRPITSAIVSTSDITFFFFHCLEHVQFRPPLASIFNLTCGQRVMLAFCCRVRTVYNISTVYPSSLMNEGDYL